MLSLLLGGIVATGAAAGLPGATSTATLVSPAACRIAGATAVTIRIDALAGWDVRSPILLLLSPNINTMVMPPRPQVKGTLLESAPGKYFTYRFDLPKLDIPRQEIGALDLSLVTNRGMVSYRLKPCSYDP